MIYIMHFYACLTQRNSADQINEIIVKSEFGNLVSEIE